MVLYANNRRYASTKVWPQGPIITTIAETDPDMNDKDISQLDQSADEASHLLKGLANPVRLKILCQMLEGERSVGEIAANIGIRDTLASQHLSLLRRSAHDDRHGPPGRASHGAGKGERAARPLPVLHE